MRNGLILAVLGLLLCVEGSFEVLRAQRSKDLEIIVQDIEQRVRLASHAVVQHTAVSAAAFAMRVSRWTGGISADWANLSDLAIGFIQQWIQTRVPVYSTSGAPQKEMSNVQMALAEASTTLDSVEGLMLRCAEEITSLYSQEGRVPTEQERARYYAWRSYIVRQASRVVDRLFELSGGHAIYLQHPLQRIWRDVHAASQHLGLQFESAMEAYGRTLVGLPSGVLL